jgi:hypothetical protein
MGGRGISRHVASREFDTGVSLRQGYPIDGRAKATLWRMRRSGGFSLHSVWCLHRCFVTSESPGMGESKANLLLVIKDIKAGFYRSVVLTLTLNDV